MKTASEKMAKEIHRSRVYTERPAYADFDAPAKFTAIQSIIAERLYEPNVVKAAWNIFGKSYEYRRKYNEYKGRRRVEEKRKSDGQQSIFDYLGAEKGGK